MFDILVPSRKTIMITTIIGIVIVQAVKDIDIRGRMSKFCEFLAIDPQVTPDVARDAFTNVEVPAPYLVPGHTHPQAAGLRNSAVLFAKSFSRYAGLGLYSVQMSKSDQRKGLRGSRDWYWSKDTNVSNRNDSRQARDVEFLGDVDYYIDVPSMLLREARTRLLYTVVPETAASHVDDTSMCFNANGELESRITGGGQYVHHLWNYEGDSCVAYGFSGFLRLVPTFITYAIERKQVAVNRQLVLLTPIKRFTFIGAILAYFLIGGKTIKRFDPIVTGTKGDKFVRFDVHTSEGLFVATGIPDTMASAVVPATVDAGIRIAAALGTTNLQMPTTASWLPKGDKMDAALLTLFHRSVVPKKSPTVYPVSIGVRSYQFKPEVYNQELKSTMTPFMSPLVHAAFAPSQGIASEQQCVKGRIDDLKRPEPKPSVFRDSCVDEFVRLVIGEEVLQPFSVDDIKNHQTRPSQQASIASAFVAGPKYPAILKCFIKKEAYQDVKDPRNISTYNHADKLTMSQYAMALSQHLKKFSWYGPGKTPIEIATRVAEICEGAQRFVNISDYHRMDGTISRFLRSIDRAIMMKAFHDPTGDLNELLKRNADNTGYLPEGTTFAQESSHGSGCPATSCFQTLRAVFTAYLAYRHAVDPATGARYTPERAFASIGIHNGDDGLDADLSVADHQWASTAVGLTIEASIVERGERGVNFLARYYSPTVWQGCTDSMSDVKRQISKFHTTVRLPEGVAAVAKLTEKALAYCATDANTPVLGELCQRAVLFSPVGIELNALGLAPFWSKFPASSQYPNVNADGWMDYELECMFPEFDRQVFGEWLAGTESREDILKAPLCAEPARAKPKVPVVVDGEVFNPDPTPNEPTQQEAEAPAQPDQRPASPAVSTRSTKSRPTRSRKPHTTTTTKTRPKKPVICS
nr:MAG: RNA-dependent RNA polymerase [Chemarfal virus 181]